VFAVVQIAGKQFEVRPEQRLRVPRLDAAPGAEVEFDHVLLVRSDAAMLTGAPTVEGARVTARVLEHSRERKIIVFRKRRRKDSKKRNGHRQPYSSIEIQAIRLP
jgi:large subunit ribosomal protein L21